ncbi:putative transcriptional regulators, CopG/Arc/MetJ family protein [Cylindrospermum sp. NIES-4074]|nr:putative transcriptional regulators, CopG/Arc/MetJ family protein [Cylindrospermum sp. NIES-4074]
MFLSLTPELEKFIQSQISSGKYTSAEEVIITAIKLLEAQGNVYQGQFDELQRAIMIGVEASEWGEVVDGETLFHQLEQKLQQRREKAS